MCEADLTNCSDRTRIRTRISLRCGEGTTNYVVPACSSRTEGAFRHLAGATLLIDDLEGTAIGQSVTHRAVFAYHLAILAASFCASACGTPASLGPSRFALMGATPAQSTLVLRIHAPALTLTARPSPVLSRASRRATSAPRSMRSTPGTSNWPEPLLQLSPHFEPGPSVQALAARGEILPATADIFRLRGDSSEFEPLQLHAHQAQALAAAKQGDRFVVTTGTGSGKSLYFFIPIVDEVIQSRQTGGDYRLPDERLGKQPARGNKEVSRECDSSADLGGALHGTGARRGPAPHRCCCALKIDPFSRVVRAEN